ncbi:MAG: NUDIX hydrolase [Patescibacteria group bacterium]
MIQHHIQQAIVAKLATNQTLRFSELQPEEIDNKLFDYHLKQLIASKIVKKSSDGEYELTPYGRKIGVSARLNMKDRLDRAFSVLFLIIRRKNGDWLLYRRKSHPLIGRVGFMHARPSWSETILGTATRVTKEQTGLTASFKVCGHGYFRVFEGENLESFTHFTLLVAEDVDGELEVNDEFAEYEWDSNPDFSAKDMLPNMADIVTLYQSKKSDFLEKEYRL